MGLLTGWTFLVELNGLRDELLLSALPLQCALAIHIVYNFINSGYQSIHDPI
jgi:hypothetical protein